MSFRNGHKGHYKGQILKDTIRVLYDVLYESVI